MTVFETARLTAAAVIEDDIAELLDVHLPNQAYLDLTEGSGGVAGAYDRGMLERDLTMSAMTPGRHMCTLRLRDDGACVGLADHGRAAGWPRLREGIIDGNEAGMALALALGMREVERKPQRIAAGECELAVMELAL